MALFVFRMFEKWSLRCSRVFSWKLIVSQTEVKAPNRPFWMSTKSWLTCLVSTKVLLVLKTWLKMSAFWMYQKLADIRFLRDCLSRAEFQRRVQVKSRAFGAPSIWFTMIGESPLPSQNIFKGGTIYSGGLPDPRYRDSDISPKSQIVSGKVSPPHKIFWARRKSLSKSVKTAESDSSNTPIHLLYTCSRLKQGWFRQYRIMYKLETTCQLGKQ